MPRHNPRAALWSDSAWPTTRRAWLQDLQIACAAKGCRKWAVVELIMRSPYNAAVSPYNAAVTVSQGKFCKECGRRQLRKALKDAEEYP